MTPEKAAMYRAGINAALDAGKRVLDGGGTAMDAVEAAVVVLEDNPVFNAGRGAVFNTSGEIELEVLQVATPAGWGIEKRRMIRLVAGVSDGRGDARSRRGDWGAAG